MSVNKREEIMVRLLEILGDPLLVPDMATVARNRGVFTNEKFPAAILLDGDETTRGQLNSRGRPGMSAAITVLHPQIFVILKTKQPTNVEGGINVGTVLNQHRGAILRAIAADAQLQALIGPNGGIAYEGAETDLKSGMPMEGQIQLSFSIACVTNPNA